MHPTTLIEAALGIAHRRSATFLPVPSLGATTLSGRRIASGIIVFEVSVILSCDQTTFIFQTFGKCVNAQVSVLGLTGAEDGQLLQRCPYLKFGHLRNVAIFEEG
jgi:hypothetical protein